MEKKYVIHILSIKAIDEETFDLPQKQNAIIVCTNDKNEYVNLCLPENILVVDFLDVEDERCQGSFNGFHARRIINFIRNLSEDVTDIYVCCSKGGSRSPAVAAALLRMSGRSDKDVWCNPYYVPNTLVYRKLCREYGFLTNKLSVWIRNLINKGAFIMAQKGKLTKYERWQIIW